MPWKQEVSVVHLDGVDYWRTWFLEECENTELFGLTEKHLGLVHTKTRAFPSYKVGTLLYLEDAPYFARGNTGKHRILGPYVVEAATVPEGGSCKFKSGKDCIVYFDSKAKQGPWLDGRKTRVVEGIKLNYGQMASHFHWFPYRFRIVKASNYKVQYFDHSSGTCRFCKK